MSCFPALQCPWLELAISRASNLQSASTTTLPGGPRKATWYRDYIETLVQRDVRDLRRIRSLDVLPRLLSLIATQTGCLLNVSDLASPFQLSRPTIQDYVTLLERVFLMGAVAALARQ